LGACRLSSIGFTLANLPTLFSDRPDIPNIAYDHHNHYLDLYRPASINKDHTAPVIIFFYGGGWVSGNKESYQFVAKTLVNQGYVVAIVDYDKYPKVIYPTFVTQGAEAVKWVYRHIAAYGGDIDRLYIMGHSAGAYIAAMLAIEDSYLNQKIPIKGVIGLSGPYHFTPDESPYTEIFPKSTYHDMKVTNHVNGNEPDFLLLHGAADELVGVQNTDALCAALKKCQKRLYPNLTHIGILKEFAWPYSRKSEVLSDISKFIK
jgi:acetyl esterase/lipase